MTQFPLARRHTGQDANLAAGTKPHRDDRTRVETAVATLAKSRALFTADDVHRLVTHDEANSPYDGNLVSSILGVWSKDGRIRRVEGVEAVSTRPTRRASRNSLWRGVVPEGGAA